MRSYPVYMKEACSRVGLSLRTCCYDSNFRMSFEEPTNPRSSEIVNNQIQLTELATYEEWTPELHLLDISMLLSGPSSLTGAQSGTRIPYLVTLFYIYIYAFSRHFYPKRHTVHSGHTFFFISMCVPWELNPQPLRC